MSEPVRVNPENHFSRAFHDGCRGIMARLTRNMKSLEAENGDQLHLWECMRCGALVLAGLAKDRSIVHYQLVRPEPAATRRTESGLPDLELTEHIGRLADKADNFVSAAKLPGLSDHIHATALLAGMADVRDELRAIYREVAGDDPWGDEL